MEHIVFFPGPDGAPSFRRLASLDDAVRLVEHLRNVENVSEVSVHALQPVPLQTPQLPRLPDEDFTGARESIGKIGQNATADLTLKALGADDLRY